MIRRILFLVAFVWSIATNAQVNIDSLSHVNYTSLHDTRLNDVWGYTDETGKEYALVGARKGTSVVDVSDPSNPSEIRWEPGTLSVWRDIKTWGDYAYVTTEAEDGLLILDLTGLPENTAIPATQFFGNTGQEWSTAHNLWIDENGYAYIFGANRGNGGVIIYDLFTDPLNPTEVGQFDTWYCHDGYVRNDTMYLAHIYEGTISIVDVVDKNNPQLLGTATTPTNFSHNIWLSDDGNTVFTTDEVADSYIGSYDVSDPANIVALDKIQSNPGTHTIPHNTHVLNNFIITSYYADGIRIHDVSDPSNLVEVGSYDTYPGTAASTIGNWGAYPYFNSGIILATDIDYGLFILNPTYVQAAKLKGNITNSVTGLPIGGVAVQIENDIQTATSALSGSYSGGIAETATRNVNYYKYAYQAQDISLDFVNGTELVQDVQLVPIPSYNFNVNVKDANDNPIFDAEVLVVHTGNSIVQNTNGLGLSEFELFYEDTYQITVGKWGYKTNCLSTTINNTTNEITFVLEEGIYDDFSFDFGWSTISTAEAGAFVRVIPDGLGQEGNVSNPYTDSGLDCGGYAYVTGNGVSYDYVINGSVSLISPVFDLTGYTDPYINYERFFFCHHGPNLPNDTVKISLTNGVETVVIDQQGPEEIQTEIWKSKSIRVSDFITPGANMQLIVSTFDTEDSPNVTEVGFDHFFVGNDNLTGVEESYLSKSISVYPNPAQTEIVVEGLSTGENIVLYSMQGKILKTTKATKSFETIDLTGIASGILFVSVADEVFKLVKN